MTLDVKGVGDTKIKTGLTLYSLSNEWWSGQYDLDSMLDRVAAENLGPGIEIVGFQTIRTYPDVTPELITSWRDGLASRGLVASCLSSNIDVGQPTGRFMTDDEMVAYLERQIETARLLGFHTIRIQLGASPVVIERVLLLAERADVKMGMELHAPEGPCTPTILPYRELYARLDSPYVGFTPDFSATMRSLPPGWVASCVRNGVPERLIPVMDVLWRGEGTTFERYGRWAAFAAEQGVPRAAIDGTLMTFTMFGRQDVEDWREIADQIVHVHGKCYGFDENGEEPSMDIPAILGILRDTGYDGFISTEWEGHSFLGPGEADGFEQVAKQRALIRRTLG
ncbi:MULTISPECIES: TIM barrel protein [unclassified Actinomyces]|uniref:sugar phosphate isomerase/epimerase family protein n=1 Tax=unclassified Actinomyces TaxID=2609248 RepID=UPI00201738EB|nr:MULTISPECIES: TIM barrel protein [unclassified Actinomyces]MCL3777458.1 sugar phosphate isomerase/epimerase [Actinomyces sp. AC-20-1]MCL3790172.1 sugar phosphate isomerase/epimerase [Actinomyces sp. 187325]MCL3792297.1 sugar phosphate isomerase/epimerase [Actinomyces sp. 186855]MCL3794874.1 sugar phosphate isomerase/epimerase [Actinomyces sp. 217892]